MVLPQQVDGQVVSTLLSVWCEDLGRLLLLRHQKGRNGGDGAPPTPSSPAAADMLQKTQPAPPSSAQQNK
ncbi:hypothetical protein JTE90_000634 [Oedothorax gibbosus]|uniref:Uncharacterized protein n=1 Tax=Oedothorax gibbosus TaxID=931172 RepID=A0AAV6VYE3_9ARAC|nr:hypothetical protein JTE90_000634 [Oedothorax gibbosus]